MQDLRQGNYMVYELGIRPRRIARATVVVTTCVEVRKRRDRAENWLSLLWVTFNELPPGLFKGGAKMYASLPFRFLYLQPIHMCICYAQHIHTLEIIINVYLYVNH